MHKDFKVGELSNDSTVGIGVLKFKRQHEAISMGISLLLLFFQLYI